jgi:hypothetical protein
MESESGRTTGGVGSAVRAVSVIAPGAGEAENPVSAARESAPESSPGPQAPTAMAMTARQTFDIYSSLGAE